MGSVEKEYDILRHEIDEKLAMHNTLLTFTITSTIVILTVAVSEEEPILYLFPFCIIIPMAGRIAHYQKTTAKLSAYMIAFLEPKLKDIKWESRNYMFSEQYGGISRRRKKFKLNCFECFTLSVVCYLLYLSNYIPSILNQSEALSICIVIEATYPMIFVFWVLLLTFKMSRMDKDRQELLKIWNEIKDEESLKCISKQLCKK